MPCVDVSPALAGGFLSTEPPRKPNWSLFEASLSILASGS